LWSAASKVEHQTIQVPINRHTPRGGLKMFKARMFSFGAALTVLAAVSFVLAQSSTSFPFSIPDNGGALFVTAASPDILNTGFISIRPDAGSVTPTGFAKLGFRANGVLVSQTTMPALLPSGGGINFVEADGPINTGLVIANPSDQTATMTVNFSSSLSSTDGNDFVTDFNTFTVPPRSHISAFINEPPFNAPTPMRGQMFWRSSVPVSLIAVRCLINQRSELVMTTLLEPDPSTLPSRPRGAPPGIVGFIPHFVDGGGWTTEIVVSNTRLDDFTAGTIEFFNDGQETGFAQPQIVTVDGKSGSTVPYFLVRRMVRRFVTSGAGPTVRSGSIRVIAAQGFQATSVMAILRFERDGLTISETSVPMMQPAQIFRMYVNESGNFRGQGRTAVVISNPSTLPINVGLSLTDLNGRGAGLGAGLVIPPLGQFAKFLTDIPGFETTPFPFRGVLEVAVGVDERICVLGFYGHYNDRLDFLLNTAIARNMNIESPSTDTSQSVFPLLLNGGGFTTESVLLGGGLRGNLTLFSSNNAAFGFTRSTN
jgi:hypothetical protein